MVHYRDSIAIVFLLHWKDTHNNYYTTTISLIMFLDIISTHKKTWIAYDVTLHEHIFLTSIDPCYPHVYLSAMRDNKRLRSERLEINIRIFLW